MIFGSFVLSITTNETNEKQINFPTICPVFSSYIPQSPILINDDSDFSLVSSQGTGVFYDPYIIEGFNITDSSSNYGIHIKDTTRYFIIRNCFIKTIKIGIFLENIANATAIITSNLFKENHQGAIQLQKANYSMLMNNQFELDYSGINCSLSSNIIISNNTLSGGLPSGYDCKSGIYISNSSNFVIFNNIIESYDNGIHTENSTYLTIGNNTITNSAEYAGIYLTANSDYNYILNNTVKETMLFDGIRLTGSSYNEILFNTIKDNNMYGCYLESDSLHNEIHRNNFINNLAVDSQGYSDSIENTWYDVGENEGNYWSDWGEIIPYDITGVGSDPYPLNQTVYANWTFILSPFRLIDDIYEQNDFFRFAKTISAEIVYNDLIATDVDYYSITLTREDIVTVEIIFNDDFVNLDLYIMETYIEMPMTIQKGIQNFGSEKLIHICMSTGIYYIAVRVNSSSIPFATYSLSTSVSKQEIMDDLYEDNDYFDQAVTFSENSIHQLIYKDFEYFRFTLIENQEISITIEFEPSKINLDMYLLPNYYSGSSLQILAVAETTHSPELITHKANYTGLHYLFIFASSEYTPQSYTLTITSYVTSEESTISVIFTSLIVFVIIRYSLNISRKRKQTRNNNI